MLPRLPIFKALMVQGTTSDAGKSTLVAGLCRVLHRQGIKVAPFKPQNMALNAAVTADGGEIGRAQAVQAQACGIAPHSDMNPVLLKPASDTQAQVIIQGKAQFNLGAGEYHDYKTIAMEAVLDSWHRLTVAHECVIVEGAGSPAEINLRAGDIANMGFAERTDIPVLLIADIDRGGVFAHIVGTLALLSPSEQARVVGFVINRFRGDIALLQPGLDWLERETGKPVLGVIPYLQGLHIEAEDAIPLTTLTPETGTPRLRVIVPVLPRISNHNDFDALRLHPQLDFQWIGPGQAIPPADLIVLPGSKNVCADLAFLRDQGWESAIQRHVRYGGKLLGICGGFQMLGRTINDPLGLEGAKESQPGLGLLAMETSLQQEKILRNVVGMLTFEHARVEGYEIHLGTSYGDALQRPFAHLSDGADGAISEDQLIAGTYIHGVFDQPEACIALLHWAGLKNPEPINVAEIREVALNRLADALQSHFAWDKFKMALTLFSAKAAARLP